MELKICDICETNIADHHFLEGDTVMHSTQATVVPLFLKEQDVCKPCQQRIRDSVEATFRSLRRTQSKVAAV